MKLLLLVYQWQNGFHLACVLPWAEFDRYELQIYEEVARMPPFQRKTLVLIGAQGVGRRSLKNRLIVLNPLRYGTTVPCECMRQRNRLHLHCGPGSMRSNPWLISFSYITQSKRRGERRPELLLRDPRSNGEGHQGEPVPGAWRVRWQPLWHQDRLHSRGGGCWPHMHPGCQPSGQARRTLVFQWRFP